MFLVFLQAFSLPLLEADTSLTRNSMPVSTVPWIEKEINEKGKKKSTSLCVHHAFLYISLLSLHDSDVKVHNFTLL